MESQSVCGSKYHHGCRTAAGDRLCRLPGHPGEFDAWYNGGVYRIYRTPLQSTAPIGQFFDDLGAVTGFHGPGI